MICHLCNEWRARRDWSDSQWLGYSSNLPAEGLVGCKRCRLYIPPPVVNPVVHTAPFEAPAANGSPIRRRWGNRRFVDPTLGRRKGQLSLVDIQKSMADLSRMVSAARTFEAVILAFVFEWMTLPAAYRKDLSHMGAVRARHPLHPVHGICEYVGPYFDPTNQVYSMSLKLMCPAISGTRYNEETLGDICEAWLAVGGRSQRASASHLAKMLDEITSTLYLLAVELDVYSLTDLDGWNDELLNLEP